MAWGRKCGSDTCLYEYNIEWLPDSIISCRGDLISVGGGIIIMQNPPPLPQQMRCSNGTTQPPTSFSTN
ncbi:hypothetical protein E2C01_098080 [Portunus trituberculatus]|uniref:Uncharacterized protein n=1 Tax=Portunus trituberculatus TaxID=210409 RepID=A0A5B7K223_PORTR|nr:hypothetical protein [Portunus trituberculatus]